LNDRRVIPLIRLFDNLIVSVQVDLSDELVERLVHDVTTAIEDTPVSGLILDFSGADLLDSHLTRRLRDLAVTARLMGVETILCGLRPNLVITLVEMGLTVPGIATALNLERALEALMLRRYVARLAWDDTIPAPIASPDSERRPGAERGAPLSAR
jgi:rsbT antagonist protein RsbS